MTDFVSLSEASKLTSTSNSAIKRFIYNVIETDDHEHRSKILPNADELSRAKEAGEPYRWKIDRDFAIEYFGKADEPKQGSDEPSTNGAVIEILREQLQSKDEQIRQLQTQLDRKDDQIQRQDERMQETHVLMQTLQQRLALTPKTGDRATANSTEVLESDPKASGKGIFGGLFRRKQ